MTTEDYITLAIFFAAGWWIGAKVTAIIHQSILRDLLQALGVTPEQLQKVKIKMARDLGIKVEEEEEQTKEIVHIKIEKHNDTLYAFRKDNDQFLGQGTTVEALIERMGEKLRNMRLIVTQEDGAELIGSNTSWEYKTDTKKLSRVDKTEQ